MPSNTSVGDCTPENGQMSVPQATRRWKTSNTLPLTFISDNERVATPFSYSRPRLYCASAKPRLVFDRSTALQSLYAARQRRRPIRDESTTRPLVASVLREWEADLYRCSQARFRAN